MQDMPTAAKKPESNPVATSAAPALDYRRPVGDPPPQAERVVRELALTERLGGAAVALKMGLGVPLSLIGPFMLACLLFTLDRRLQAGVLPGFMPTFAIVTIVVVPL